MASEAELSLAQRLAHVEKSVRDAAFATISTWVTSHKAADEKTAHAEMLKMWKALFYCMWMSDKAPVQQELALNLAKVLRSLTDSSQRARATLYVRVFFETMTREWTGLDQYRVNKYMSLIRRMLREMFRFCAACKWAPAAVGSMVEILRDVMLDTASSRITGIRLHLADIYVTELMAAVPDCTTEQFQSLAEPVYAVLGACTDKVVVTRVIGETWQDGIIAQLKRVHGVTDGDDQEGSDAKAADDAHMGGSDDDAEGSDDDEAAVGSDSDSDSESGEGSSEDSDSASEARGGAGAGTMSRRHQRELQVVDESALMAEEEARVAGEKRGLRRIDVAAVARKLFTVAADPTTRHSNRQSVYDLHATVSKLARKLGHAKSEEDTIVKMAPTAAAAVAPTSASSVSKASKGKSAAAQTSTPAEDAAVKAPASGKGKPAKAAQQQKAGGKGKVADSAAEGTTVAPAASAKSKAAQRLSGVKRARVEESGDADASAGAAPALAALALPTVAQLQAQSSKESSTAASAGTSSKPSKKVKR